MWGVGTIVSTTTLFIIRGQVEFHGEDDRAWLAAVSGSPLSAGMGVRTRAQSYALVAFRDGTTLSLDPDTEIELALNSEDDDAEMRLAEFSSRSEDQLSADETLVDDLMVAAYVDGTADEDDEDGEAMADLDDGPDDEELQAMLVAAGDSEAARRIVARLQDASAEMSLEDLDLDADDEAEVNASLDADEPDNDDETSASAVVQGLDMGASERPMRESLQIAVAVNRGSVWARVEAQSDLNSMYTFDTPSGSVTTRGATLLLRVGEDKGTALRVGTGMAMLEAGGTEVPVAAGQESLVPANGTPSAAAEVPPPARALRLTLTTKEVL